MAQAKVTSLDVAKRAGVSQSAVSRVFTPGASASPATADKVRRAADELGYRPNPLARAMITGKSKIIGLIVANLDNQFYPLALEKLSRALQAKGYHVLVFLAQNSSDDVSSVLRELVDYKVDGIVTASVAITNELAALCETTGIPVVMFNRGQDDTRLSHVTSDNLAGGRSIAQFLVAGGHKKIAHIAGWQGASTGRDRAQGFIAGLADHGMKLAAFIDGHYDREKAAAAAREMFSTPDRPDAVFVGNDHMAFAVMDTLRFELGLRIPEDVSVVGYDDVPMASWPAYDLTSLRQPINQLVDATVTSMLDRIEGHTDPRHIAISGPLIIRGSARKVKGFSS